MKRIIIIASLCFALVLLTACGAGSTADATGAKDAVSDTAQSGWGASDTSSQSASDVLTSDSSADVDIALEEGDLQAGNNLTWPADKMGNIPDLGGTITVVMAAETGACVVYTGITEEQATAYVASLEALGYQGYNYSDDETIVFSGQDSAGASINFSYGMTSTESSVTYASPQK